MPKRIKSFAKSNWTTVWHILNTTKSNYRVELGLGIAFAQFQKGTEYRVTFIGENEVNHDNCGV